MDLEVVDVLKAGTVDVAGVLDVGIATGNVDGNAEDGELAGVVEERTEVGDELATEESPRLGADPVAEEGVGPDGELVSEEGAGLDELLDVETGLDGCWADCVVVVVDTSELGEEELRCVVVDTPLC